MPKYKVVNTIVDESHNLIGFSIQAKDKDLGGVSDQLRSIDMSIDALKQMNNGLGFHNFQMDVNSKGISLRSNFKLSSLPMVEYDAKNNEFRPVSNEITLTGRYVKDNQNIGFDVTFYGNESRAINTPQLIKISNWYKPANFSVARKASDGKAYIKGKNISINDLPAVVLDKKPMAKQMKPNAQDTAKKFGNTIEAGFDIIDVYDIISKYNGQVIKLPGEKYQAATTNPENTSEGFVSYGIGEVASPNLMFNSTKLNVNAGFKKVGYVPVQINGSTTNITTYIYRSKSLFYAGENYIRKFGIAVPVENERELINALSASLAIEKIEDNTITAPLGQVIDAKSLAFYLVKSDNLDLISSERCKKSILTAQQIAELCKRQYEMKLISKYMGPRSGIMAQLRKSYGPIDLGEKLGKKPFGIFALMDKATLQYIESLGFDIYTGAYTNQSHGGAKKPSEETTKVEIVYSLKGYDAGKFTAAAIKSAIESGKTTGLTANVVNAIKGVEAITDVHQQYAEANKLYKKAEAELAKISRILWMHNAAMYIQGNKVRVHTGDKSDWVETATRSKVAQVFENKTVEGLTIKLTGVTI